MNWDDLKPILVAVAIGIMVGAERERSHRDSPGKIGGVRTFALLAATGALAAVISPEVIAVGFVAVGVVVAVGYWSTIQSHPGSTTAVSALATYLLGALTRDRAALAVGIGVVIVVLLLSKERLHRLLRDVVSDTEAEDAVKLLVLAFVVLPLLPDRGLGPYGVINPFRIWLLVVAVVGIGWLGYLGVRVLGSRRGLLVSGLAGGFVSASATTAAMGRLARPSATETAAADSAPQAAAKARSALAGALAASISTMVQLALVIGVVSRSVLAGIWAPALAAAVVLAAFVVPLLRRAPIGHTPTATPPTNGAVRAFALRPALVLAAVITTAVLVSRWASDSFGGGAAIGVAALAGLADGHAGAVSAASLAARGDIDTATAVWAAAASLGTNSLVKVILAFAAGGRGFGLAFSLRLCAAAAAFALVAALS